MPPPSSPKAGDQAPFELKGSLFTLTVMRLKRTDLKVVETELAAKVRQAPGFFCNAPVVLDLEGLAENSPVDFAGLYDLLRRNGLVPVGVRNAVPGLQAAAVLAGLPVLPDGKAPGGTKTKPDAETPQPRRTRLITQPVRSGQQIYAPDGDLIVTAAISPGAEVLADGNIHIYGRLRGRALAGAKGDTQARIFCQHLEAELVSIAGHYRVMEDLDAAARGKPVQLFLLEDRLIIEPLSRQDNNASRGLGG